MKKKVLLLSLAALTIVGCNKFDLEQQVTDVNKDTEAINENAKTILGDIDPKQDWNSTTKGEVTITADADMSNIVKVQILTESPFLNGDAKVLNEANAVSGQTVTLNYEAPNVYTRLVAACVNSDGVYYVKGFKTSDQTVSFQSTTRSAGRRAAADTYNFPALSNFWLPYDNSFKSYNAMRAINSETDTWAYMSLWKNSGWENDRMWRNNSTVNSSAADYTVTYDYGWEKKNFSIRQALTGGISEDEKAELETIFNRYLKWTKDSQQLNNLEKIRESKYVSLYNNEFTANGDPIVLTPVQSTSRDMKYCDLYYYYYNPDDVAGMSDEEEAQYIRELPKIMGMACGEAMLNTNGTAEFYKNYQYVLPYYGEKDVFNTNMDDFVSMGICRIRNGQEVNGVQYYMTYNTNENQRMQPLIEGEGKEMQLWQVFKNSEGICYLYNIGSNTVMYNNTYNGQQWKVLWGSPDNVTSSVLPYKMEGNDTDGYQFLATIGAQYNNEQMLGTDLAEKSAKNYGIWSDKKSDNPNCKWYIDAYDGNDVTALDYLKGNKYVHAQSYTIPAGYKVGFLLKVSKTNSGDVFNNYKDETYHAKNNGEVYADGRLNTEVNQFPDYFVKATEDYPMKKNDPRAAIFSVNNKTYMTLEDGCDCNYVDMIIEVSNGIELVEETPEVEAEAYTMCFEDRPKTADYDLNDVVLRCVRKDATTVTLSLVACGGNDDVIIHGATGWAYNDKEVHEAFGMTETTGNRFINTESGGTKYTPLSGDVTIPSGMTIPQYLKKIFIYNKTTDKFVQIAKQGEAPFAIIIPREFDYPREKVSIITSHAKFKEWANDATVSKDWYMEGEDEQVYTNPYNE